MQNNQYEIRKEPDKKIEFKKDTQENKNSFFKVVEVFSTNRDYRTKLKS